MDKKKILKYLKNKKLVIQIYLIFLYMYNLFYNVLPFWIIKKILFKVVGNSIGKYSYIHTPVKFFSLTKKIKIGNNTTINSNCYLDNRRGIFIGNNVNIAHNVKIYTLGHDINSTNFIYKGSNVNIKNNSVIFSNSLIMPGVTINEGAVVYPGSVVVKDIPAYNVVGGNPAIFIKKRRKGLNYKINNNLWFSL